MKQLLSTQVGGPETLELVDSPSPAPGAGQLHVRVLACGVNYPDVLIIEDKYQAKPPRPFAPGGEISAEVIAVGEGVAGWKAGDRLIAVDAMNDSRAYMVGKRLIEAGKSPAADTVADPSTDLKALLKA